MRKTLFITCLLISFNAISQEIKDNSLLWEITGNGLKKPSYLFGTMHVMCAGDVFMAPHIQEAFDQSQSVLLELKMDDPSIMMKMMQVTLSQDGKTISDKLGEELSAELDSLLRKISPLNLAMVNNMNLQTLSMQIGIFALDCPLDLGYDMLFVQEAVSDGKPIEGLESVELQIQTLLSQSDEESKKAIEYMINNFGEIKTQMSQMLSLYKAEDVQGLYDLMKMSFNDPEYPQMKMETLLDDRNVNWIPIIEKAMKDKPVFIAVGAAHLAGEMGVINLLQKQGYQVEAVKL